MSLKTLMTDETENAHPLILNLQKNLFFLSAQPNRKSGRLWEVMNELPEDIFVGPKSFQLSYMEDGNPKPLPKDRATEFARRWMLLSYRFCQFKQGTVPARLVWPENADRALLEREMPIRLLARDIINFPANKLSPADLQAMVEHIAAQTGAKSKCFLGEDLEREFPTIAGIGMATGKNAPRVIEATWGDDLSLPLVSLVGKGVCFDTGGWNLKNDPSGMHKDKAGAAAALALALMLKEQNLPCRIHLVIPALINVTGENNIFPGDVLQSRSGKWVEITNTDSEGRLVLAEGLSYVQEKNPDAILTFGTLTYRSQALLLCHDKRLSQKLKSALKGEEKHFSRHVPQIMPVKEREQEEMHLALKSQIADIANHPSEACLAGEERLNEKAGKFAWAFMNAFFSETSQVGWVHTDFPFIPSCVFDNAPGTKLGDIPDMQPYVEGLADFLKPSRKTSHQSQP